MQSSLLTDPLFRLWRKPKYDACLSNLSRQFRVRALEQSTELLDDLTAVFLPLESA
jgi:hypothetical protein